MSNPSRLEKPVIEARETLGLPSMMTETTRDISDVRFLSTGVKVSEQRATQWIDSGQYPSVLNNKGANLRTYKRLVERTEWDARRKLFLPVALGDIVLSQIEEEPSNITIAVQKGFGPGRLKFPTVVDPETSIGVIQLEGTDVATGDADRFMRVLEEFNETASQQQTAA